MTEHPLVSIVTASLNKGRFIRETIESVLTQDYPHIEYLVVDAGSTDGTPEILSSYNGRLRYICEPDRGQADGINKGFEMSRGSIFAFLNADDTYVPGAVGKAVNHLLRNPSAGVVYGEANYIREDGSVIARYPTLPFDVNTLNRCCFICQPAAFLRSEVFRNSGCLNPAMHYALDYDLWMRVSKDHQMLKVDDILANSRMYRENKTLGQRRRAYMEILSAAKLHYGYIPFDWVYGYSSYLLDRKDQFFEISHPSLLKIVLSLALGTWYNPGRAPRYWSDWARHVGLAAGGFHGRYSDGWISKTYVTDFAVPPGGSILSIAGRHIAPLRDGLRLDVQGNGRLLGGCHVQERGPFTVQFPCPAEWRGRNIRLRIDANQTFRPMKSRDYRHLSCIIDSIDVLDSAK